MSFSLGDASQITCMRRNRQQQIRCMQTRPFAFTHTSTIAYTHAHAQRCAGRYHRGPDADPWSTEGGLTREHQALQHVQAAERAFLKRAFRQTQVWVTHVSTSKTAGIPYFLKHAFRQIQVGGVDHVGFPIMDRQLGGLVSAGRCGVCLCVWNFLALPCLSPA